MEPRLCFPRAKTVSRKIPRLPDQSAVLSGRPDFESPETDPPRLYFLEAGSCRQDAKRPPSAGTHTTINPKRLLRVFPDVGQCRCNPPKSFISF